MRVVAEDAGWKVRPTYARGTRPGRVLRVVDSLALRMNRAGDFAAGIWNDGKFDTGLVFAAGDCIRKVNATELRRWLLR